jgi:hypothetical protein
VSLGSMLVSQGYRRLLVSALTLRVSCGIAPWRVTGGARPIVLAAAPLHERASLRPQRDHPQEPRVRAARPPRQRPGAWRKTCSRSSSPRSGEHRRKPEALRELIEAYCDGLNAELFARSERPGWAAWGLEVGKVSPLKSAPPPGLRPDMPITPKGGGRLEHSKGGKGGSMFQFLRLRREKCRKSARLKKGTIWNTPYTRVPAFQDVPGFSEGEGA